MLKTTPLNAAHQALGARMVDFGGWDMPVNYGSQIEEHHAVRRDAGMFDVSHMLAVDVHGAGAREFLRRALANNVDKLREPGRALYACMLNDAGGVVDDLIVYFLGEEWFRLVVNAGRAEGDLAWLESLKRSASRAALDDAAAARSRHDRGARARTRASACGRRCRRRARRAQRCQRFHAHAGGRTDAGAHRLHRRRRLRTPAAGRPRAKRCGSNCSAAA